MIKTPTTALRIWFNEAGDTMYLGNQPDALVESPHS